MDTTIGAAIRLRRRALGLTQARLAVLTGLDQPAISRLEAGSRIPPLPTLERVAGTLGLRVRVTFERVDGAPVSRAGGSGGARPRR